MGLFVRGFLVGRKALGTPKPGKPQLYAWQVQDDEGGRLEVLSSDILGASGEQVEIPVNPRVKTKLVNGANQLMDAVSLWAAGGLAGSSVEETAWAVPGRVPSILAGTPAAAKE